MLHSVLAVSVFTQSLSADFNRFIPLTAKLDKLIVTFWSPPQTADANLKSLKLKCIA